MTKRGVLDIFGNDDDARRPKDPTLEMLCEYEKHFMALLRSHQKEIEFLDNKLRSYREEQKKFFSEDLPAIRRKMTEDHIDEHIQKEWMLALERSMQRSFDESHKLLSSFAVKKLEEFRFAMENKLKRL